MNFTSKFDLYFNRVGLKELKARADFMGVSSEAVRKYFNEGTTPDDLRIVDTAKKLGLTAAETQELLELAQDNRAERKRAQREAREAAIKKATESVRDSRNSSDTEGAPPKNGTCSIEHFSGLQTGAVVWMKVIGSLPRGVALEDVTEFEENKVPVMLDVVNGHKSFVLRVREDSMSPRVIPGDAVVLLQDLEYGEGNVVAARDINEDGFFMARFGQRGNQVILTPENKCKSSVSFSLLDPNNRFRILGRTVTLIRDL